MSTPLSRRGEDLMKFSNVLTIGFCFLVSSCSFFDYITNKVFVNDVYVEYQNIITVTYPSSKTNCSLIVLLPMHYSSKQTIINESFSLKPQILKSYNNRYALFDLSSNVDKVITITCLLKLHRSFFDLHNHPLNTIPLLTCSEIKEYLGAEKYLEVNSQELIHVASKLLGKNDLETVKNTYKYVKNHIRYTGVNANDNGALYAYNSKIGDCTEYSDLFITLCRINKIPARFIEGCTTIGKYNLYAWAEAYISGYGWLSFDPTWGDHDIFTRFDSLKNSYIYLSNIRNDEIIKNSIFHYNCLIFSNNLVKYNITYKTKIL